MLVRRVGPAALLILALALAACGDSGGDSGGEDPSAGDEQGDEDDAEDESETGDDAALGDRCEDTALIVEAPTRIEASLRNASAPDESDGASIGASCGLTGPTVFVKATLDARADLSVVAHGRGFSAKFAVLRPGCSADPARVLACGETLPVTLTDIGPDVELLIAIGIDRDDPALALPSSESASEGDPLDFELRLEASLVLAEHAICGPGYGRCEAGTVCLPELLDGEDRSPTDRCRRPPADSCAAPGVLAVPSHGAPVLIEILPDEPHSDAHEHECTGWRRPERVEQLELPERWADDLGEGAILRIHADDPRVGLALRGSTCLPEHALACAPATATGDGTTLSLAASSLPGAPILFIELPAEALAPLTVSVELFD